jgi:hypothetical protein
VYVLVCKIGVYVPVCTITTGTNVPHPGVEKPWPLPGTRVANATLLQHHDPARSHPFFGRLAL